MSASTDSLRGPVFTFGALVGRVAELSTDGRAGSSLTWAVRLVAEAHATGESAAWVRTERSTLYLPDAALAGADLTALPIVSASGAEDGATAARMLLESGAFGLVVVDLGNAAAAKRALVSAHHVRVDALVRLQGAALVYLTDRRAESGPLAPVVSLYGHTSRKRWDALLFCRISVRKDDRHPAGWVYERRAIGSCASHASRVPRSPGWRAARAPSRDLSSGRRVFEELRALFGADAVRLATVRRHALPERRVIWSRASGVNPPRHGVAADGPLRLVRRLFDEPIALPDLHGPDAWAWTLKGLAPGGLPVRTHGPLAVESRDYYFVDTPESRQLIWLYLDRATRSWFIQGLVE